MTMPTTRTPAARRNRRARARTTFTCGTEAFRPDATQHDRSTAPERKPLKLRSMKRRPGDCRACSDDFAARCTVSRRDEEAVGDDHVIKGRVVKLTATHVVVDYGAKSEGMGCSQRSRFTRASPVPAGRRDRRHAREGEIEEVTSAPHLKAQRLRSWDEIERAYNEKKPIKGIVLERSRRLDHRHPGRACLPAGLASGPASIAIWMA